MKNYTTFAAFKPKNKIIKRFVVVAIFIAAYLACIATNIGYQTPVGYCGNVVICSLARMEGDSLSLFKYFNFSFTMPKNNENASKVNNSTLTSTPDCESVLPGRKQFDFSAFNNYFTDVVPPDELIESLQEIQLSYLELSLFVLMDMGNMKTLKRLPHQNVQSQINRLEELINLIKTLK